MQTLPEDYVGRGIGGDQGSREGEALYYGPLVPPWAFKVAGVRPSIPSGQLEPYEQLRSWSH